MTLTLWIAAAWINLFAVPIPSLFQTTPNSAGIGVEGYRMTTVLDAPSSIRLGKLSIDWRRELIPLASGTVGVQQYRDTLVLTIDQFVFIGAVKCPEKNTAVSIDALEGNAAIGTGGIAAGGSVSALRLEYDCTERK